MLIHNLQGLSPGAAPPPASRPPPVATDAEVPAVGTRQLVEVEPQTVVPATQPPPAEIKAAVTKANRAMAALSASLSFEVDAQTKTTVVKVIDTSDNSVLRQIPSQEMLEIARALDRLQGMLLRDKA